MVLILSTVCSVRNEGGLRGPGPPIRQEGPKLPILLLCTMFFWFHQGATRKLDHYPDSVEEFVDHLSFLGKIGSEMSALNKEYNVVIKLYTIAKDFDLPVVPEEYALYQTLSPSFQHLKVTSLSSCIYFNEKIAFCRSVKL